MAEVTPGKRHNNMARFTLRLAGYKKHSEECKEKYQQTFDALVEQDIDQTTYLKQKFLQSKEKRAAKKKLDNPNSNVTFGYFQKKREDENEPPTKLHKTQEGNAAKVDNVNKFSIQLNVHQQQQQQQQPQQLDYTSPKPNVQITNNVTIKSLNTSLTSFKTEILDEKKPIINQNMAAAAVSFGNLPTINTGAMSTNPVIIFKQDQSEYINEGDLQHLQPMDMNKLSDDAFSSLISEISDFDFSHNHLPPPQQQQHQEQPNQLHHRMSQMMSHQQQQQQQQQQPQQHLHTQLQMNVALQTTTTHQVQVKVEDVNKNVMKSHNQMAKQEQQQQSLLFHVPEQQQKQRIHQLHHTQHMQHQSQQQQPHQVPNNQQIQFLKQQQQTQQSHQHSQHHQQPQMGHVPHHAQVAQLQQQSAQHHGQQQYQQQLQQQQIRHQSQMQQTKQIRPTVRPQQPPEYNINVRTNNPQFAAIQCNMAQRLPPQNPSFPNGAILRPPSSNGIPNNNRSFSEELITLSQQRSTCHQLTINRLPNEINSDWRNMMAQQRHSQQPAFRGNFVQTQRVGHNNVNNNAMNMIPNQLQLQQQQQQQLNVRQMATPEQLKQTMNLQNINYGGQLNMQMLHCMSNGAPTNPNQAYSPVSNSSSISMYNSLPAHMRGHNMTPLHQPQSQSNTHRNLDIGNSLANNSVNQMPNCNSSNEMNTIPEFAFFEQTLNENELLSFLQ